MIVPPPPLPGSYLIGDISEFWLEVHVDKIMAEYKLVAAETPPTPPDALTPALKKAQKVLKEYGTMHILGKEINVACLANMKWKRMDAATFAWWSAEMLAMHKQVLAFDDGAYTRAEHAGAAGLTAPMLSDTFTTS